MKMLTRALLGASALSLFVSGVSAETLTIATVNNGDMIRMQGLTDDFTEKTGHTVEWVTLEENVLRQRVTTDITTKGGAFDIMTIGMYETPIWGKQGWLVPLDGLSADYDVDDLLPAMRSGLSADGTLYAGGKQLYRSTDQGKTWKTLTKIKDKRSIVGIEVHPEDSNTIWISANVWSHDAVGAIYKSTDGGSTWVDMTGDIPFNHPQILRFNPLTDELWAGYVGLYKIKQ